MGQGGAGLLHEEKQSRTKDSLTVAEQGPGSDSNRPRKSRMANQAPQPTQRSVKARYRLEEIHYLQRQPVVLPGLEMKQATAHSHSQPPTVSQHRRRHQAHLMLCSGQE